MTNQKRAQRTNVQPEEGGKPEAERVAAEEAAKAEAERVAAEEAAKAEAERVAAEEAAKAEAERVAAEEAAKAEAERVATERGITAPVVASNIHVSGLSALSAIVGSILGGASTKEGVLVVSGPAKGRRRAGRAFGPTPERIPLAELSEDDIAAIAADPELASHREEGEA